MRKMRPRSCGISPDTCPRAPHTPPHRRPLLLLLRSSSIINITPRNTRPRSRTCNESFLYDCLGVLMAFGGVYTPGVWVGFVFVLISLFARKRVILLWPWTGYVEKMNIVIVGEYRISRSCPDAVRENNFAHSKNSHNPVNSNKKPFSLPPSGIPPPHLLFAPPPSPALPQPPPRAPNPSRQLHIPLHNSNPLRMNRQ